MRENIARSFCLVALAVAVLLSWAFAARHNPAEAQVTAFAAVAEVPPDPSPAPPASLAAAPDRPSPAPTPETIARGVAAYDRHNCATCHAIAGTGNPRYPLDGAGSRWDAAELREWTTGTGVAAEVLSPAILRRKQRYREMPEEEMAALVAYLSTLKQGAK